MTRKLLLLTMLKQAGDRGVTTAEILQAGVGSRYGARLLELRKEGHEVTAERVREGMWRYRLVGVERGVGVPPVREPVEGATVGSSLGTGGTLFDLEPRPHWMDAA